MRLDKYLKVSRLIKRRTLAKEVADNGRVEINDQVVKSSSKVNVGDELKITLGNKVVVVKVLNLMDSTKKQDAQNMYEILSETKKSQ